MRRRVLFAIGIALASLTVMGAEYRCTSPTSYIEFSGQHTDYASVSAFDRACMLVGCPFWSEPTNREWHYRRYYAQIWTGDWVVTQEGWYYRDCGYFTNDPCDEAFYDTAVRG